MVDVSDSTPADYSRPNRKVFRRFSDRLSSTNPSISLHWPSLWPLDSSKRAEQRQQQQRKAEGSCRAFASPFVEVLLRSVELRRSVGNVVDAF